jgi:hypothetical protein
VLRLFGFLVLGLLGAGGLLFLDFNRVIQDASAAEAPPPTFQDYLGTVPEKLASLAGSARSPAPVLDLPEMMPRAPEGWTMRPVAADDIDGFLPRSGEKGDPEMVALVKSVAGTRVERGAEVAVQTYERGERRVVFQLVRLPDSLFTDPAAFDRRHDLQIAAAAPRGRPFLTVRGLDVTESFLGDGIRARFFSAHVGAQIEVRVLASRRLKDTDLVPFFETLNVQAMNAAVIDRQPGLGEVPVLVLGSALSEADLAAYEADRAARADLAIERAQEMRAQAEAEVAAATGAAGVAPAGDANPLSTECRKDSGGIKRCSVTSGGDG